MTGTTGLTFARIHTTPGVHPYDEVTWETRDVVQTNWKTGETIFEQRGVEFPDFWSANASTIATTKYFRGNLGSPTREKSLRDLIDRIALTYSKHGRELGYFSTERDAEVFEHELIYAMLHQIFAFNSPVWFNVGVSDSPQVSACFLLGVEDSMESVLDWYKEEGLIFKGGSGAGVNLSKIRSSKELLSSGGTASGPVSFMRGADASAGTIKSGGATRRAAKLVCLDVDHPDIEEFINVKAREEDKIRALRDAGFDMDLNGKDIVSVQYQNANNSVQVTDDFMRAVEEGRAFGLRSRTTGEVIDTVDARKLFRLMAEAAWGCADPGIQFRDTINSWHTLPAEGPITTSNPCSEYVSIDNSSCNLASINLLKFLSLDGSFDQGRFADVVQLVILAMDISVSFGGFPTEKISENTKKFRQLGIGYANLGALLMASGLAYDSDEGRDLAASITSLMSAAAHVRSSALARSLGPYDGWDRNQDAHKAVVARHAQAGSALAERTRGAGRSGPISAYAETLWGAAKKLSGEDGLRNSQLSLLAPTGTISFVLDCDTTGIEPDFSLVKFKKLVGGGSMQIVNETIPRALVNLRYTRGEVEQILAHVAQHGTVVGAPGLKQEHYPVFDCAVGERAISPMGHVKMMAACQPFLSGAISKTVNLPETATVEEIEEIYMQAWWLGLKSLAVYRDNCKVGQPLSSGSSKPQPESKPAPVEKVIEYRPVRRRLPKRRPSQTTSFSVGGAEGYLIAGSYPDNGLGEIFLKFGKQGSTLGGIMDAFSIAMSIGLQYGVPLETFVEKFTNMSFEPSGPTDDPDIRMSKSIIDYLARRLALDHLDFETRSYMGIYTARERAGQLESESPEPDEPVSPEDVIQQSPVKEFLSTQDVVASFTGRTADAPICLTCGTKMRPAGSCYVCEGCGSTSGCS